MPRFAPAEDPEGLEDPAGRLGRAYRAEVPYSGQQVPYPGHTRGTSVQCAVVGTVTSSTRALNGTVRHPSLPASRPASPPPPFPPVTTCRCRFTLQRCNAAQCTTASSIAGAIDLFSPSQASSSISSNSLTQSRRAICLVPGGPPSHPWPSRPQSSRSRPRGQPAAKVRVVGFDRVLSAKHATVLEGLAAAGSPRHDLVVLRMVKSPTPALSRERPHSRPWPLNVLTCAQ